MSLKVCEVVRTQKSIQARKDDDCWKIEQSKFSIFSNAFAKSNLRLFRVFLNRWNRLDRLYNSCHRKYWAQERLVEVWNIWRIDREHMMNQRVKRIIIKENWEHHMLIWRSKIRDKFNISTLSSTLLFKN